MGVQKPSLPQGTRDFTPEVMVRRNFILDTIKKTFQRFGFLPLETPAMERLDVLTGKYGEEGDRLIFRVFNAGSLRNYQAEDYTQKGEKIIQEIADRALRYDLTVPFARFVVMNRGQLTFPFKRYQIQPVWRGDSPQKGRYREFYQCDADVVGTDSLICEAEIILMINEVLENLSIQDFTIKINNRKILAGLAEVVGEKDHLTELCVAIDKLDKIGEEKVLQELLSRGFSEASIQKLRPFLHQTNDIQHKIQTLKKHFEDTPIGREGLEEVEKVLALVKSFTQNDNYIQDFHIDFDITLARGLSYYTGAIFEVKANDVKIGSISGGGRYDNLTGTFGMPNVSGVGFSFGVDRIYDVMEELNVFPADSLTVVKVMFAQLSEEELAHSLPILRKFRQNGINCELYPSADKLKKQLNYANQKKIPYVVIIGSDEISNQKITLKIMETGEQLTGNLEEIILKIQLN